MAKTSLRGFFRLYYVRGFLIFSHNLFLFAEKHQRLGVFLFSTLSTIYFSWYNFYMYKPPRWVKTIPQGSHGSFIFQKKLWKTVSDYVRILDFYAFGSCISCGRKFQSWQESDAGHYKSFSSCRGYSKFDTRNIFAQCKICNSVGSSSFVSAKDTNVIGGNFKDNIRSRFGEERIKFIESLDSYPTEKMEEWKCVDKMREIILLMDTLPEKPPYYQKVIANIDWNEEK